MEQRNLILAVLLSTLILIGWSYFFDPPVQEQPVEQAQSQTGDTLGAPKAQLAEGQVGTGLDLLGPALQSREAALSEAARVTIDTPRVKGSLNLKGALLDDLSLNDYRETLDEESANIVLLSPKGTANAYFTQSGWVSATLPADQLPNNDTVWTTDSTTLSPEQPVTLTWDNGHGVTFIQRLSIDDEYLITLNKSVVNNSGAPVSVTEYALTQRVGTPDILDFYILHEGLIGVFNDTLEEVDYSDLQEDGTLSQTSTGGWLGITDKYWLVGLVPDQTKTINSSFKSVRAGNDYRYQADYATDPVVIADGASLESLSYIFAGAKRTTLLDRYEEEKGITNFDLAVDFGWFYFLTKPIFYAIHWLNEVLGNFGLAILALTVAIKLVMFPLANKSYVSMSRMKLLQPKMQELKERYGDDRQAMNVKMMELYKQEKVNPLAGCLPILVQIPVFFSLYKVLFVTIEMRHAPFYGWIEDLSAKDPLGLLTLFGMIDWNVPASLDVVNIGIWPLIMGLTMWLQQKLNPAPADPIQQKVFAFMPIMFTFLLATFPAGLVIYWAWNNSLSILQQWVIMRRVGAESKNATATKA